MKTLGGLPVKSAADIKSPPIRICLFGPSGSGKTRFAGNLPGKKLFLAAEGGMLSLQGRKDVSYVEIKNWEGLRQVSRAVFSGDASEFDWLVFDSLSRIAKMCLEALESGTSASGAPIHGLKAYGEMAKRIEKMIWQFAEEAPMGVLFICQEDEYKDGDVLRKGPRLPGNVLQVELPYALDVVLGMLQKRVGDTVERAVQTADDGVRKCKDRSGTLPFIVPPKREGEDADLPNVPKLIELIKAGRPAQESKAKKAKEKKQ